MAEPARNPAPSRNLHGVEPAELMKWWGTLEGNRGDRAQLRRADRPDDVLLTRAFFNFLQYMPERWASERHLYASALVAATLAHVRQEARGGSFARQLAGDGERPVMSELRFRQLLKSRTPEEFFRRLLRAVRLLGGSVNLQSLTEGILQWYDEYLDGEAADPRWRLGVKWAKDYYANPKPDQA